MYKYPEYRPTDPYKSHQNIDTSITHLGAQWYAALQDPSGDKRNSQVQKH